MGPIEDITPKLNEITPFVKEAIDQFEKGDKSFLKELFLKLGYRGILTCLGIRETVGSIIVPFPSISELFASFNKQNQIVPDDASEKDKKKASKLTVGGRAMLKHCHRSAEGFWGSGKGTDA